jgi:3-phenylpropionate/trans-cinnamate dioxygenase ferredoxin component
MNQAPEAADRFIRVASVAELPPNSLTAVEVSGVRVCLVRVDGEVHAFRDNCSHRDFPLSAGTLEDGTIECAWHGARFDVATGRAVRLPAIKPVRKYDVKVENGEIFVAVDD